MMLFGIIVKVLGFLRTVLIAKEFGSNEVTDVYYLAVSFVIILTSFIGGALNQATIPLIVEIETKQGSRAKFNYISSIINVFAIISICIIIILYFLAPQVVNIMTWGNFTMEQRELATQLIQIGLPAILIYNVTGIFRGLLQSEKSFFETAIIDIPFNIVYLLYLMFLSKTFGVVGLMVAHLFAVFSQYLLQKYSLKKINYRHQYIIEFQNDNLSNTLKLIGPIFLSIAVNDINLIIDKTLASSLDSGAISTLEYGNKINVLVLQLFVTALAVVIFPYITEHYHAKRYTILTKTIEKGIYLVLITVIPLSVFVIFFSESIIQLLFERGAFDATATTMTSQAMIFYILGLVPSSIKTILMKLFYATKDSKTPFYNSVIGCILNIIFNIILIRFLSFSGLALATSISSLLTMIFLFIILRKNGWTFNYRYFIKTLLNICISIVPSAFVTFLLYNSIINYFQSGKLYLFILLLLLFICSFSVYGIMMLKLEKKTPRDIINMISGKDKLNQ